MFQTIKFQKDLVTGKAEVRILFQLKQAGNIIEDGGTFSSELAAKNWLRKLKTEYFLIKVENYICHKKKIIDNAPQRHKSMIAKEEALKECFAYLNYAVNKRDLREVCKWCLTMKSKLEIILPNYKNYSYDSSKKDLEQILEFAKDHSEGAILRQAN